MLKRFFLLSNFSHSSTEDWPQHVQVSDGEGRSDDQARREGERRASAKEDLVQGQSPARRQADGRRESPSSVVLIIIIIFVELPRSEHWTVVRGVADEVWVWGLQNQALHPGVGARGLWKVLAQGWERLRQGRARDWRDCSRQDQGSRTRTLHRYLYQVVY